MGELLKHSRTGQTEESPDPALWYRVDEQALGYLNAVLGMAPTLPVEHNEVRFVHRPDTGWTCTSRGAAVNLDDSLDLERALRDVEILKKENESLKFKKELASIDVEVAKSENADLKAEMNALREQLQSSRLSFEALQQENSALKTDLAALHKQLLEQTAALTQLSTELTALQSEQASRNDIENAVAEATPPREAAGPSTPCPPQTNSLHTASSVDSAQSAPPQSNILPDEKDSLMASAIHVSSTSKNKLRSGQQPEPAARDEKARPAERKLFVFPQECCESQRVRPFTGSRSRILKPGITAEATKVIATPIPSDGPQDTGPTSSEPSSDSLGTRSVDSPSVALSVPEAPAPPNYSTLPPLQSLDSSIKLKPSLAPKVVVRKNYEALQKESESPTASAEPLLTLIT